MDNSKYNIKLTEGTNVWFDFNMFIRSDIFNKINTTLLLSGNTMTLDRDIFNKIVQIVLNNKSYIYHALINLTNSTARVEFKDNDSSMFLEYFISNVSDQFSVTIRPDSIKD